MTPQEITAAVVNGSMSHQTAIAVFAALYGKLRPSSELVYPCEQCGALVAHDRAHSYQVNACMPGHALVGAFQCEALQHFACSEACAAALVATCLTEHLFPAARARRAALPPLPETSGAKENPADAAPTK